MRDEFTELDITAVRSFSCWVASSLLDMEKRFQRIMGYQQLWTWDAKLKALAEDERIDTPSRIA
jgi:hypothetical protein